jgi:gas vesicle protein
MSDKSSKGFIYGFLAGGIIGAVVALLYAPKTGKEMRDSIKKNAEKVMGEADDYIELAKNSVSEVINEAKKKSEDLVTHAKEQAKNLIAESEELLIKAKDQSTDDDSLDDYPISGLDAYKKDKF